MTGTLEHANFTVTDPVATASWMTRLFGWNIRWQGAAMAGGFTVHIGSKDSYIALYTPGPDVDTSRPGYQTVGCLNHIGVVVPDLDATEAAVKAEGFETGNHADYEPGRRFYFHDADGLEYEVVQYG
ncbi:Glyoxalase family protein [Sulfitobacter noctilucicola]|uniref:Catechol 2,3-dioxygenase-like lactoylglutathione lyase family enzyme n=1 Tax=Sulfitobacter noctilucicola TaxID=1342301 RepID=A0A7W6M6M5_9RHOB|nr:VOC family protein [Sulfitobacter noctilucicola]KIN62092.1 Glyoxalase family protein [Sulfitobacter noctilucicola]MBB4173389.1 catechol 2,3-dioxygenase-like lactoylglutathione lyase family enzyme [Sulfitobacter noctilucicola]